MVDLFDLIHSLSPTVLMILIIFAQTLLSTICSQAITDSYGLLPVSNLSCYVCSTIDDINCKYLNETIQKYNHQLMIDSNGGEQNGNGNDASSTMIGLDSNGNGNSDSYSSHHYTVDSGDHSDLYGSNEIDQNTMNGISSLLQEFRSDCLPEDQYCGVIRLGVSAPDNVQEFNFFALKRGCLQQCTDGCFIIGNGERTKLSICSACCTTNYCNIGSGFAKLKPNLSHLFMTIISFFMIILWNSEHY